MMNRRSFWKAFSALVVGAAVDPDFLKWEPGARAYFDMSSGRAWTAIAFRAGDIVTFGGYFARHPQTGLMIPGRLRQFVVTHG